MLLSPFEAPEFAVICQITRLHFYVDTRQRDRLPPSGSQSTPFYIGKIVQFICQQRGLVRRSGSSLKLP